MINFNELIDSFLRKELKKKEIGRYYPSEIGGCLRRVWFSYKYPKETNSNLIKIFEVGNMLHDFIVDVLKSEKNPEVELLESELPFKIDFDDFIISGRIDDIVLIKMSGKKVLVEVKSTSTLKFTNKPSESHVMQLQLYMHNAKVHDGIIMYLEKNTLQAKWFNISYDKDAADKIIERFKELHKYLMEDKMPVAEARLTNRWMCKNCNYSEECI